jgi:hypothetical protein
MLMAPFLVMLALFGLLFNYLRDGEDLKVAKKIPLKEDIPIKEYGPINSSQNDKNTLNPIKSTRDYIPNFNIFDSDDRDYNTYGGYKSSGFFEGGRDVNGLSIHSIRWSRHNGYERLVFDISDDQSRYLSDVGRYSVGTDYSDSTSISGKLLGCNRILGISPNFSGSDIVYRLDLSSDTTDGCFFTVALKRSLNYKVFVLPNPARLIIDFRF